MAVNLPLPTGKCYSLNRWASRFIANVSIACVFKIIHTLTNEITTCNQPMPPEIRTSSWLLYNRYYYFRFRLVFNYNGFGGYDCININEYQQYWNSFLTELDIIKSSLTQPEAVYWIDSPQVLCQPARCDENGRRIPAQYGNTIIVRKSKIEAEPQIIKADISGYNAKCVLE